MYDYFHWNRRDDVLMGNNIPLFALPKLESQAQTIIAPRRAHIEAFARQCVREHDAACDADALWQTFREIEPTLD
jgi:hypothetical protein